MLTKHGTLEKLTKVQQTAGYDHAASARARLSTAGVLVLVGYQETHRRHPFALSQLLHRTPIHHNSKYIALHKIEFEVAVFQIRTNFALFLSSSSLIKLQYG